MRDNAVSLATVQTLVRRDYLVSRSYRLALILDFFFGIVTLLVYYFISHTFHHARTADLGGAPSYFAFAAVGVALNVVVQVASIQLARRVREEQLTGTLEMLAAQPVNATEMALGFVGFHYFWAMARATFYILIAWAFLGLDLSNADWPAYLAVLLSAALAMSAIGITLAAGVLVFKRADTLVAVVVLTLGFAGGAFFPIDVLPDWLEPFARVLPTHYAFSGVRAALFGGDAWQADTAWLLVFAAVGLPLAISAFGSALGLAKRQGSLATY